MFVYRWHAFKMAHVLLLFLSLLHVCHVHTAADYSFDVFVHGATPGGVTSAVAAARHGVSVVLVHPGAYIGGAMTGGLSNADYGMHASSVIGGLSMEFFQRVAVYYNVTFSFPPDNQCAEHDIPWVSEPHVAEQVFVDMLSTANVTVVRGSRILRVVHRTINGSKKIVAAETSNATFSAAVFIDASYEGSLMKMAGVKYTWGREANTTYNESTAGRLPGPSVKDWPFGVRSAQLPTGINPYVDATNTSLIAGVWNGSVAPIGGADDRVGSYDWRLTLTDNTSNWIPIPAPDSYDPAEFELVRRTMRRGWKPYIGKFSVPGRKTDLKMFATFGEHVNAQWSYPNGTWEEQQAIVADFKQYALALIHFFRIDPSVPESFRKQMMSLGLCRDEYNRSAHWMPQLYVRSALRMVGRTVLTQHDVVQSSWVEKDDSIGVASYTVDIPGPVQTIVENGEVVNEGSLKVPYFCDPAMAPFALPYGTMLPRKGEVDNLLVPVAVSASHVAFNAVRMEPTWMVLGHAAGVAAAMAAKPSTSTVQTTTSHHVSVPVERTSQILLANGTGNLPKQVTEPTSNSTVGIVAEINITLLREKLRADGQILAPVNRTNHRYAD